MAYTHRHTKARSKSGGGVKWSASKKKTFKAELSRQGGDVARTVRTLAKRSAKSRKR